MPSIGAYAVGHLGGGPPALAGSPIAWGTRETIEPGAPFLRIPPGMLDCVTTALERIYKQFEANPNWEALARVFGQVWCEVNGQQGKINVLRYVMTAEGVQLDEIGYLVGRAREGLTDDLYRLAIIAQAASLITSSTIPEIIDIARVLVPDPAVMVELTPYYPATWVLCIVPISTQRFLLLQSILGDVPAAGVAALLCTYDPAEVGGWDTTTGSDAAPLGSWSSTTDTDADGVLSLWSSVAPIGA